MRAAVFAGEGRIEIRSQPEPALTSDRDVIVRVEVCGICGSDVRALSVPPLMPVQPGVTMGHEFVGKVVEAGAAMRHLLDRRVVAVANVHCGHCVYCRSNEPNHCDNFVHLGATTDGAFAERCVLPGELVHPVPAGLPTDVAALAEPLACVINALRQVEVRPGSAAVIAGAGPIGLLATIVAKLAGAAPVIVSQTSPTRRAMARDVGADVVVDPRAEDLPQVVFDATAGVGAAVAVDAVGTQLEAALLCLRKGGAALIIGLDQRARTTVSPSLITDRELTVKGSYATRGTFPAALDLLAAHPNRFGALITGRYPLEAVAEGVAAMREGRVVKALVYPAG